MLAKGVAMGFARKYPFRFYAGLVKDNLSPTKKIVDREHSYDVRLVKRLQDCSLSLDSRGLNRSRKCSLFNVSKDQFYAWLLQFISEFLSSPRVCQCSMACLPFLKWMEKNNYMKK